MIQLIRSRATPEQMLGMLEALGIYIKLAVDIECDILAGGGELHVDCEQVEQIVKTFLGGVQWQ